MHRFLDVWHQASTPNQLARWEDPRRALVKRLRRASSSLDELELDQGGVGSGGPDPKDTGHFDGPRDRDFEGLELEAKSLSRTFEVFASRLGIV